MASTGDKSKFFDVSTAMILQSSVIQSEKFHDILINGFEDDKKKYENPFRYYGEDNDLVILDDYTASGKIQWSIFEKFSSTRMISDRHFGHPSPFHSSLARKFIKHLIRHLQSLDADMVLIIKEVDRGGLFSNLFLYHEDKEIPFYFDSTKFSTQEDLFLAVASCEQTVLKFIKHMKSSQRVPFLFKDFSFS